ncbi:MAG: dienelactone hydrolase family protein [Pseudomonadales bacterium]
MSSLTKRIGLLLGLLIVTTLGTGYAWYAGAINIESRSFAQNQALVVPHIKVILPTADKARPAVLLFHGCGGVKPSLLKRAQALSEQGYVAVIVDSYTGRHIEWQKTCAGREFFGSQRAADVLVALDYARAHPAIDPEQLFLIGYSHGGWTILESLAYGDDLPRGLTDNPSNGFKGVQGLVAWYPYCGIGAGYTSGWEKDIPVLVLLAAEDEITDPEPCIDMAQQQAASGGAIDWHVYANVSHAFDTGEDWVKLYDAESHQQALAAQLEFLKTHVD